MLALALTLQLLGPPAAVPASPELHLVPPLALSLEGQGAAPAAPELSPPLRDENPWRRAGQHALSSGGFLLGDAFALAFFVLGYTVLLGDLLSGDTSGDDAELLLVAGAVTWIFLPPALGVRGAQLAGAPSGRGSAAYWVAFLLHFVTTVAILAAADKGNDTLAAAAFIGGELVLAPYAIVRILEGAPLAPPEARLPSPAERALPAR